MQPPAPPRPILPLASNLRCATTAKSPPVNHSPAAASSANRCRAPSLQVSVGGAVLPDAAKKEAGSPVQRSITIFRPIPTCRRLLETEVLRNREKPHPVVSKSGLLRPAEGPPEGLTSRLSRTGLGRDSIFAPDCALRAWYNNIPPPGSPALGLATGLPFCGHSTAAHRYFSIHICCPASHFRRFSSDSTERARHVCSLRRSCSVAWHTRDDDPTVRVEARDHGHSAEMWTKAQMTPAETESGSGDAEHENCYFAAWLVNPSGPLVKSILRVYDSPAPKPKLTLTLRPLPRGCVSLKG